MFEVQHARRDLWLQEGKLEAGGVRSRVDPGSIKSARYLLWEEHCVECAVPDCYTNCSLFVRRGDNRCARFVFGIYPNPDFPGHFEFGADVRFRRWGKLQAALKEASLPIGMLRHSLQERFAKLPDRLRWLAADLYRAVERPTRQPDEFVIECFSPHPDNFSLTLEYFLFSDSQVRETRLRTSFEIAPGYNFFAVPFEAFGALHPDGHISVSPGAGQLERRIIFTWLDFVQYRGGTRSRERPGWGATLATATNGLGPADKVKCVAWDLDNTLWDGILAESSDSASLRLRPEVRELIEKLDQRGILQTLVSKNDHDAAWQVVERLGIQDYFIYPAINWGQKSENLKQVAERINIGLDTIAFIDDSAFEREEVKNALPQVRVYSEQAVSDLLTFAAFDVPITETSRLRRRSYLAQMQRERVQASFKGDYDDFLLSCEMQMRLFVPEKEADVVRCWELVQRSNQLNLSGRRYTLEAFRMMLETKGIRGLAFHCQDKFSDYGIVGFVSIEQRENTPFLRDFVLSCRVAQKKVEHTFLRWLADRLRMLGNQQLKADLVVTNRNGQLRQVFDDLPFEVLEEGAQVVKVSLDLSRRIDIREVISVVDETEFNAETVS